MSEEKRKHTQSVHLIQKAERPANDAAVLAPSDLSPEDPFKAFYPSGNTDEKQKQSEERSPRILTPPIAPASLEHVCKHNEVLMQAIDAMEVNIEATGLGFERIDPDMKEDDTELKMLKGFFAEPYPRTSFTHIRRKIRRDRETIGYGACEVLTNLEGKPVFIRALNAALLRYCELDEPVQQTIKVERDGAEVEVTMMVRERRFVQLLGNKRVYHSEFGSTRQVNRDTGVWLTPEEIAAMNAQERSSKIGTQLLLLEGVKTSDSAYPFPRWLNNTPSALGSRKAEEFNLSFFDAGGVPPVLVFLQGGRMVSDGASQLNAIFAGQLGLQGRSRGAVIELETTDGTLDKPGKVEVKVERFGELSQDALFQKYLDRCADSIRVAFRLPSIFLGRNTDYNYATARAAYMVAEAQVFKPERDQLDDLFTMTVLKALGAKTYKMDSRPLNIKDADLQLKALDVIKPFMKKEDLATTVNNVADLQIDSTRLQEPVNPFGAVGTDNPDGVNDQGDKLSNNGPQSQPKPDLASPPPKDTIHVKTKGENVTVESAKLANELAQCWGLIPSNFPIPEQFKVSKMLEYACLKQDEKEAVNEALSVIAFGGGSRVELDLMSALVGTCTDGLILDGNHG